MSFDDEPEPSCFGSREVVLSPQGRAEADCETCSYVNYCYSLAKNREGRKEMTTEVTLAAEQLSEEINKVTGLNFSEALCLIKKGKKVARVGWNGKDMFIFLVNGSVFKVNRPPLLGIYAEGTEINYRGHIDMKTACGQIVPWVASQSDLLSVDWFLVETV